MPVTIVAQQPVQQEPTHLIAEPVGVARRGMHSQFAQSLELPHVDPLSFDLQCIACPLALRLPDAAQLFTAHNAATCPWQSARAARDRPCEGSKRQPAHIVRRVLFGRPIHAEHVHRHIFSRAQQRCFDACAQESGSMRALCTRRHPYRADSVSYQFQDPILEEPQWRRQDIEPSLHHRPAALAPGNRPKDSNGPSVRR